MIFEIILLLIMFLSFRLKLYTWWRQQHTRLWEVEITLMSRVTYTADCAPMHILSNLFNKIIVTFFVIFPISSPRKYDDLSYVKKV